MYRVYDKEKRKFVDDVFVLQDGFPYRMVKRKILPVKLVPAYEVDENENERFVIQYCTDFVDKDKNYVYEGDICRVYVDDDEYVVGVVAWSGYTGSYCIFCNDIDCYYPLSLSVQDLYEVIGNVCDDDYGSMIGGDNDDGEDS